MILNKKGKQIAPCIVSKVRDALKVPNGYSGNSKTCSKAYWDEACQVVGRIYGVTNQRVNAAKKEYNHYIAARRGQSTPPRVGR